MGISKELKKEIQFGDYTRIRDFFNTKHRRTDHKNITATYVQLILEGARPASSDTAEEVIEIAELYLTKKKECKRELIAA